MLPQCYVQIRFKLTSKLLKFEVQTAKATYPFLFCENVTSVTVISSALFRIIFFKELKNIFLFVFQNFNAKVKAWRAQTLHSDTYHLSEPFTVTR